MSVTILQIQKNIPKKFPRKLSLPKIAWQYLVSQHHLVLEENVHAQNVVLIDVQTL